jgi:hypothetical protein
MRKSCAYRKCYPARMPLESATFKTPTEAHQPGDQRVTMLHWVEHRSMQFLCTTDGKAVFLSEEDGALYAH